MEVSKFLEKPKATNVRIGMQEDSLPSLKMKASYSFMFASLMIDVTNPNNTIDCKKATIGSRGILVFERVLMGDNPGNQSTGPNKAAFKR